jgi:hypothetical protein
MNTKQIALDRLKVEPPTKLTPIKRWLSMRSVLLG